VLQWLRDNEEFWRNFSLPTLVKREMDRVLDQHKERAGCRLTPNRSPHLETRGNEVPKTAFTRASAPRMRPADDVLRGLEGMNKAGHPWTDVEAS
jgi:hypothetical protein